MNKLLIGFLLIAPLQLFAQKATFFADTIYMNGDWRNNPYEGQMKWTIQNQTFGWGETIEVDLTKNQMDTVFFQKDATAKIDTILCDIKEVRAYRFIFNACCGAFNVLSADKKVISGEVMFSLNQSVKDSTFLGAIAETACFVEDKQTANFSSMCSSAMASNISIISMGKVADCVDKENCQGWMCFFNEQENQEDFLDHIETYEEKFFEFLFMPLNDDIQEFNYDLEKQKLIFCFTN